MFNAQFYTESSYKQVRGHFYFLLYSRLLIRPTSCSLCILSIEFLSLCNSESDFCWYVLSNWKKNEVCSNNHRKGNVKKYQFPIPSRLIILPVFPASSSYLPLH